MNYKDRKKKYLEKQQKKEQEQKKKKKCCPRYKKKRSRSKSAESGPRVCAHCQEKREQEAFNCKQNDCRQSNTKSTQFEEQYLPVMYCKGLCDTCDDKTICYRKRCVLEEIEDRQVDQSTQYNWKAIPPDNLTGTEDLRRPRSNEMCILECEIADRNKGAQVTTMTLSQGKCNVPKTENKFGETKSTQCFDDQFEGVPKRKYRCRKVDYEDEPVTEDTDRLRCRSELCQTKSQNIVWKTSEMEQRPQDKGVQVNNIKICRSDLCKFKNQNTNVYKCTDTGQRPQDKGVQVNNIKICRSDLCKFKNQNTNVHKYTDTCQSEPQERKICKSEVCESRSPKTDVHKYTETGQSVRRRCNYERCKSKWENREQRVHKNEDSGIQVATLKESNSKICNVKEEKNIVFKESEVEHCSYIKQEKLSTKTETSEPGMPEKQMKSSSTQMSKTHIIEQEISTLLYEEVCKQMKCSSTQMSKTHILEQEICPSMRSSQMKREKETISLSTQTSLENVVHKSNVATSDVMVALSDQKIWTSKQATIRIKPDRKPVAIVLEYDNPSDTDESNHPYCQSNYNEPSSRSYPNPNSYNEQCGNRCYDDNQCTYRCCNCHFPVTRKKDDMKVPEGRYQEPHCVTNMCCLPEQLTTTDPQEPMVEEKPVAYNPKRNGLDTPEGDRLARNRKKLDQGSDIVRKASPVFRYVNPNLNTKTSYQSEIGYYNFGKDNDLKDFRKLPASDPNSITFNR